MKESIDEKILGAVILLGVIAAVVMLVLLATGCEETHKAQVWGQGEPPLEWQGFFGNDNIARLNFVQTNAINKQSQAMTELAERILKLERTCLIIFPDPNLIEVTKAK